MIPECIFSAKLSTIEYDFRTTEVGFVADYDLQDHILGHTSFSRFHVLFSTGTEDYTAVQAIKLALHPLEQLGMARFYLGDQFPVLT